MRQTAPACVAEWAGLEPARPRPAIEAALTSAPRADFSAGAAAFAQRKTPSWLTLRISSQGSSVMRSSSAGSIFRRAPGVPALATSRTAAGARPAAASNRPAIRPVEFRRDVSIPITVRIGVDRCHRDRSRPRPDQKLRHGRRIIAERPFDGRPCRPICNWGVSQLPCCTAVQPLSIARRSRDGISRRSSRSCADP